MQEARVRNDGREPGGRERFLDPYDDSGSMVDPASPTRRQLAFPYSVDE